jgi:hypothetical protein
MGFLDRILGVNSRGEKDSPPRSTIRSGDYDQSQSFPPGNQAVRQDLLRVVLRDTLLAYGIPAEWITAELLTVNSRTRGPGIHWRLQMRHWDAGLVVHAPALEEILVERVTDVDIWAPSWLRGVSWQFVLPPGSPCPPMPVRGAWTADIPAALSAADPPSSPS